MTGARSMATFTIAFAISFAVLYLLSIEYNWALFTYHPAIEEFGFLVQAPKDGPAMYWYGWLATAALGGAGIAAIAALLPDGWAKSRAGSNLSWGIPLVVMVGFVYILRRFFLR
jgi:hypothetical protein